MVFLCDHENKKYEAMYSTDEKLMYQRFFPSHSWLCGGQLSKYYNEEKNVQLFNKEKIQKSLNIFNNPEIWFPAQVLKDWTAQRWKKLSS